MVAASELPINTGASALQMAQAIFGDGVTVVNASYTGDNRSSGIYSNGDAISPEVTPGDTGVILSTGKARDFTNSFGDANHRTNTTTNTSGVDNDPAFNALVGRDTHDASILDVDFIPTGDTLTMQFVLSSEEYPEFFSQYTDSIGVWINGTEVPLEAGSGIASVNNINPSSNINLFNDNTADQVNTEMDGYTITLTMTIPVTVGTVNSLRIGIADVADSLYDSNLLIAGDSVQTTLVALTDHIDLVQNGTHDLDVLANDINSTGGAITVTHINGQAVVAGDTVTLATGQMVTLNADGTFTVSTDADIEEVSFTYGIESSTGLTDVGFVTVNTIPCFVAGTMIRTPDGEKPVEQLVPGDLVITYDDGPQPVRWIGRKSVSAFGNFAPVHISRGVFGRHRDIWVSPQHRVLVSNSYAELLFGEGEVLIAAKDLVDGRDVCIREGGVVDYVHILFDRHQVVFSNDLATESFLPGPQTLHSFENEILQEIRTIFPELDLETGLGYSPAVRRTLRKHETRVLRSADAA